MDLKIKGRIYKGKILKEEATLSMGCVYVEANGIDTQKTDEYPVQCPRCMKRSFYICKDADYNISFCAQKACMQDDSECSKSNDRERRLKEVPKNEYGISMTGAEFFNLGILFKNASLSKWISPEQYHQVVFDWMKGDYPFLVIMGNPGTGKTYLCSCVLNYLFESREEVFFTTHRRFISSIHNAIQADISQNVPIDKIAYKKYLIYDDLGSSAGTEWQKEVVLDLIDKRYSDRKKTLITTNLTKDEVYSSYGSRTASRLFDKRNKSLEMWTEDMRQQSV